MIDNKKLSSRLRQATQGCTQHLHGPVQAWWIIMEEESKGHVDSKEVARMAAQECTMRITQLIAEGVSETDTRIKKELITKLFILNLFGIKDG